ncbi:MAG: nucleotidyltransferase domain-containing protein [Candidatus Thermoplasmatota archaeon]|nr:nucleotidyltransferase domain-containing protein [Candidatus Thermoplasmatota archaeon]
MGIIERRIKERNMVIDQSRNFAQHLPSNTSAFLVGSYARGDFNLWSDIDIVVISNFVGNPLVRLKNIDFPPGFEIIPITPDEFWKMASKNNPLYMEIKKSGIMLRDDLEIVRVMNNS